MEKHLAFIISAGRTGTTFLGNKASEVIEDCHSTHEPDNLSVTASLSIQRVREFGLWHMIFGRMLGRTGPRAVGTRFLVGSATASSCQNDMERMRYDYFARQKHSLVIESNPQWHYAIDLMPHVWPNAKIAVIVRDPRTWIQSWIRKGRRHTKLDLARYFPPGRITPCRVRDYVSRKRWRKLDTFGKLAWEWQAVNRRLIRHAENNPLCRIFLYEDLFGNPASREMERLIRFLASHHDRQYRYAIPTEYTHERHHASTGHFPDWQSWHPNQAMLVDSLCGDIMKSLGYGFEDAWRDKLQRI